MHDLSRRACQFLLSACTGCVGDSSSLERWQLQLSEVFAEVVPSDMPVVGGTLVGMATVPTRQDLLDRRPARPDDHGACPSI